MNAARNRFTLLALVVASASLTATATEATLSAKSIVIRAGKLVNVVAGKTLSDRVIVIDGESIKAVGPAATVKMPTGAEVIDLTRATVLPGLIDVHAHLTSDPTRHAYKSPAISEVRTALYGVRAARHTVDAGFTSVRNVGADGFDDVVPRDAINAADLMGWKTRIGSISTGKFADMIAMSEDPAQDATQLTNVRFVMKGGNVVKLVKP